MNKRRGVQKGAQRHAEGQQGDKTHNAFLEDRHGQQGESLESEGASQGEPGQEHTDVNAYGQPVPGHHRLFEDRQQHDEAEKNSEANRLQKELGHEKDADDRLGR
jgi:hypothetical protein